MKSKNGEATPSLVSAVKGGPDDSSSDNNIKLFIEGVPPTRWNQLVRNEWFRGFLENSLSKLLVNTFNSYYGFHCKPDGIGLSRSDTPKAHNLKRRLFDECLLDGRNAREATLLIFKYRRQLRRDSTCLWDGC